MAGKVEGSSPGWCTGSWRKMRFENGGLSRAKVTERARKKRPEKYTWVLASTRQVQDASKILRKS